MDISDFVDRCRQIRNGSPNAFYALVDTFCRQADAALDIEDIQRRCRAAAERCEVLAGPAKVDTVVSADLLLEAASLIRGYHQSLLLTELDRQRRNGVGVFDPNLMIEDGDYPDYRRATAEERAMARGFVTLWESVGVEDADDWLYTLRNRAELLASLDDGDCREAQDNTPSLGPFHS